MSRGRGWEHSGLRPVCVHSASPALHRAPPFLLLVLGHLHRAGCFLNASSLVLLTILSIVLSIISSLFLFTTSTLRTEDLILIVLQPKMAMPTLGCLGDSDSHRDRHCLVPQA